MPNQNLYTLGIFAWVVFWVIFSAIFLVSLVAGTDSPWVALGITLLVAMGVMHEKVAAGIVASLFAVNNCKEHYQMNMIEYHEDRLEKLLEVPWDSSRDLAYHRMAIDAHRSKLHISVSK